MPADAQYDVIIIGSGAGGGTLARRLAPSGKRVLILERGGFLPRERENWDPREVFERNRYRTEERWYDAEGKPFRPYTHYWVGGNTKVYGAALLRLRASDFGEVRHHGGVSPAWPVGYDVFEPYYAEAERLYSVHGERGADPTEPWASGAFPFGVVPPEPTIGRLMSDLSAGGLSPFPVPLGVRMGERERGAAPVVLSNFDGYPDLTEVKADAHVVGVRPAMTYRNVSLMTRARVERLNVAPGGRTVTGVTVERDGERIELSASIVVLAAGAINSAAILLRSRDAEHPEGLANSSGLVGRNYMCHQNGCVIAVVDEENPSAFQKHFGIADFYHRGRDDDRPLGLIQLMGKPDRGTLEWLRNGSMPGVAIEDIERRTYDFFITAEDLPDPENRVVIRGDGAIGLHYRRNNTEAYERLQRELEAALRGVMERRGRSEPVFWSSRLGIDGVSHQNGTLRFGSDPRASVLDVDCRAHDLDNLYAADASFFPSSAAVNPSLTIMANALRVGDRILERLGVGMTREAVA